jgi:hypothetical protein
MRPDLKKRFSFYILGSDRQPIPTDFLSAAIWHAENEASCIVGADRVKGVRVCTVFTPMNLQYRPGGEAILFETMLFAEDEEIEAKLPKVQWRYESWDAALQGHRTIVAALQQSELGKDEQTSS